MTCVVSLVASDRVYMAGESLMTTPSGLKARCAVPKVFNRGELTIGISGTLSLLMMLFHWDWPEPSERNEMGVGEWMQNRLLPCMRNLLEGRGVKLYSDSDHEPSGMLLVAVRSCLFRVDPVLQEVVPIHGSYAAIGSGSHVALGSLHTSGAYTPNFETTVRRRLELALEAASDHCSDCAPPFVFSW